MNRKKKKHVELNIVSKHSTITKKGTSPKLIIVIATVHKIVTNTQLSTEKPDTQDVPVVLEDCDGIQGSPC